MKSIIRIDLQDALEWLGDGIGVAVSNVFPSPAFDTGYDELLRTEAKIKERIIELSGIAEHSREDNNDLSRLKKANIVLQKIC